MLKSNPSEEERWYMQNMAQRAIVQLEQSGFQTVFAKSREEALEIITSWIPKGSTVGFGGSRTLSEVGILERLRQGEYELLDRDQPGLDPNERYKILRQALTADIFLSSVNAVSLTGQLVWIDGYGNRVAPILFGPDKVILIVGINKLCMSLEDALRRARFVAAPINARRLNKTVPCIEFDSCEACHGSERICNYTVVMEKNPCPERIQVLIVDESLGF